MYIKSMMLVSKLLNIKVKHSA